MATALASGLPSDILRLIFDLLDQPGVIACAAVCREWRATAVLARLYYRALSLLFPTVEQNLANQHQIHNNSLEILLRAARDAKESQYSISLAIEVRVDWEALSLDDSEHTLTLAIQMYEKGSLQIEKELVPALRRAIPHLVRLDLQGEWDFLRQLLPTLTVPAPLLRVLKVHVWVLQHGTWYDPVPHDLFSGQAPLLTKVDLAYLQLRAPAPCFGHVRNLHWDSQLAGGQLSEISACFPRIRHLALHDLRRTPEDPVSVEEATFFGRLRSLYIGHHVNGSALEPFLPYILQIPDVEICAVGNVDALADVLRVPAPEEMILSEHVAKEWPGGHFSHLRIHLRAPTSTRSINSCVDYGATLRTLKLSSAALSLTKITVDDRHIRALMQACPSMPLLEHLSVVLIAWATAVPLELDRDIDCACPVGPFYALDTRPPDETLAIDYPRLHTLELRATHAGTTVRADVFPALSHGLGQLHLVLSNGVSLDHGIAAGAFASIRRGSIGEFVPSADTARVAALLKTAAQHPERIRIYDCPHLPRTS